LELAQPSGVAAFDQTALEIVRDSTPFEAPPAGLLSDDGALRITWTFARDERRAAVAGAAVEMVYWPLAVAVPRLLERGDVAEAARRIAASPGGDDELLALADQVALAAVQRALGGRDVAAQRAAVRVAATAQISALAPALRALSSSSVDLDLRLEALEALGRVGSRDAMPELLAQLSDGRRAARSQQLAAARALSALGAADAVWEQVAERLATGEQAAQTLALELVAEAPSLRAVLAVVERAGPPAPVPVRTAAMAALGQLAAAGSREAGRALIGCLGDRDAAGRAACARALAQAAESGFESRLAYWAVVELVRDRDERVRAAAARAAAALGRELFARELYRFRKETSAEVLAGLAAGLAVARGDAVVAQLQALAAHSERSVALAAERGLVRQGGVAAAAVAERWWQSDDGALRAAAVLATADRERAEVALRAPEPGVRAAGITRLIALDGRAATRARAMAALAAADQAAVASDLAGAWLGGAAAGG
jgi:HEAT repeat protein